MKDTKNISKAIILDKDSRVLLLLPYDKPRWHLPGGHLHEGESFVDGIKREVLEETGLSITRYQIIKQRPMFTLFICNVSSVNVKLSSEHIKARWVGFEEFKLMDSVTRETKQDVKFAFKQASQHLSFFRKHVQRVFTKIKERVDKKIHDNKLKHGKEPN